MKLKRFFLSLVILPLVAMPAQAQLAIESVILKNPQYTDVLKIGIDTVNQTISLERCFAHSTETNNCQMIGKAMPIAEIENIHTQLDSQFNATFAGAFLSSITYFGVISFCLAKGKCSGLMSFLFQPGGKIDWGLWIAIGFAGAGGALGFSYADTGAGDYEAVLQIQAAVEEALNREDNEQGDLVLETQASLNKIVESFSMLQLLIKSNAN